MHAEVSSWWVTFFADNREGDVASLFAIMAKAKKKKITFGSAGVIPLEWKKDDPSWVSIMPYVTLLYCGKKTAKSLVRDAGLCPNDIHFETLVVVWPSGR